MRLAILAIILSSLVSAGGVWKVQSWRYEAQIADIQENHRKAELQRAAALVIAVEEVRAIEQLRYAKLQEAEREARTREQTQRAAADRARAVSDSLRDNLSALKAGLPGLTETAVRERASTLTGLLGDCSNRYQRMAETAQRHASDVTLLLDSWPR